MSKQIKFGNRFQLEDKVMIKSNGGKGVITGIWKEFVGEHFSFSAYYFGAEKTENLQNAFRHNFYVGYDDEKKKFITCYFKKIVIKYLVELENSHIAVYFQEKELQLIK